MCMLKLRKFQAFVPTNYSADQAKIWYEPKADATLSLIPFSLKSINKLGFHGD